MCHVSGLGENFNIGIFSDTRNVMNVKLCMMRNCICDHSRPLMLHPRPWLVNSLVGLLAGGLTSQLVIWLVFSIAVYSHHWQNWLKTDGCASIICICAHLCLCLNDCELAMCTHQQFDGKFALSFLSQVWRWWGQKTSTSPAPWLTYSLTPGCSGERTLFTFQCLVYMTLSLQTRSRLVAGIHVSLSVHLSLSQFISVSCLYLTFFFSVHPPPPPFNYMINPLCCCIFVVLLLVFV